MSEGIEPPVGDADERALPGWRAPPAPPRAALEGRHCRLVPLDAHAHAAALHAANATDVEGRMWRYLAYGPFESLETYAAWVVQKQSSTDPLFFAVVDSVRGTPTGVATYMRIEPAQGSIEIGHLAFSPLLQRTPAATEALYLLLRQVFALGYRRCEWKCNAANAASRAAARRLGFRFEGVFRQHMVVKGRNRDTAWYSIIDGEWPAVQAGFERWLDPSNFDEHGQQRRSLADCRGHESRMQR
jgi:RimJ/RimL family protein N-acetyltransferase